MVAIAAATSDMRLARLPDQVLALAPEKSSSQQLCLTRLTAVQPSQVTSLFDTSAAMAGLDETLNSIATRLNELAERHLTEQISTEQYAFDLDALLADVPALEAV